VSSRRTGTASSGLASFACAGAGSGGSGRRVLSCLAVSSRQATRRTLRTGKSGTTNTTCSLCRRRAAACTTACPGARRGPTAHELETPPAEASGRACSTPGRTACAGCAPTQAPGGLQPRDGPPRSCATEALRHAQPWRRAALPDVRAGAGASCARSTPGRGRMCLTYGTTVLRFSDARTQGTIQRHSEAQVSQAHGSSDGGGVQASHGQPTPSLKTLSLCIG
jgi:hypothetical protein